MMSDDGFIFAERFRSDISCGGTQSGSAATVTLHEIVCNDWFGSVVSFDCGVLEYDLGYCNGLANAKRDFLNIIFGALSDNAESNILKFTNISIGKRDLGINPHKSFR